MTLAPLLSAPLAVQIHVAAALAAIAAIVPLAIYRKGASTHRWLGWIAAAGMGLTALSSFAIRELNHGSFSWIHILSVIVLISLIRGIIAIRRREVRAHMWIMASTAVSGLGVAGAFTFMPYRLMWRIFFG
ncbi:MAG: DUF2306 domain-containing protein [Pseudomonadota bacterium]